MAIRIPESLRDAEINVSVDIPKPKITTEANKDGSLSISASYDMGEIDKLTRNAARALNEEVESSIIEELLELNGYVKGCSAESTCRMEYNKIKRGVYCSHCGARMDVYTWEHHVDGTAGYLYPFCYWCGSKVVED